VGTDVNVEFKYLTQCYTIRRRRVAVVSPSDS